MKKFTVVKKKLPKRERKLVSEKGLKPGAVWREERRRQDIREVMAEERAKNAARMVF
jgi:hypothetical protein